MRSQTFTWTVLPAGPDRPATDGLLRLAVHVAPRLVTDEGLPVPALTQFPDLLDWPATVAGIDWTVRLDGRQAVATRVSQPRSDLWRPLFAPSTFVRPPVVGDLDRRKVRSYPVRNVVEYLTEVYRRIAITTPTEFPSYATLIGPDALGPIIEDPEVGNGPIEDRIEVILNREQAVPPGPPDPPADFVQLRRFHRPRGQRLVDPLPPDFDIHDVLALALEHPSLMRLLGLVVELEVSRKELTGLSDDADSATPAVATLSVTPQWTPAMIATGGTSTDVTPGVRCLVSPQALAVAPREVDPELTEGGHLPVGDPQRFVVVQLDPDGAALKALSLAGNLPRSRELDWDDQAQAYALPSLRSGGFAVARVGRAPALVDTLKRGRHLHDALAAGQPIELDAEDVTRGYRIDVWDSRSGRWHPLLARNGRYTFVSTGRDLLLDDEGALTATPSSAADRSSTDLYLQEALFQWIGWSLGAPVPGTALDPQDQVSPHPDTKAVTKFPLEIRFRPQPGTLPRLRFGVSYRFRMRAVDLAGQSRAFTEDDGPADTDPITSPVRYGRYEPAPSPVLAWRRPGTEGETIDQLVIRSDAGQPATQDTQRHVVPPQGAQQVAEHHGMFDTPASPGHPSIVDRAAWAAVGAREGGSLATSPQGHIDPAGGGHDQRYFDVDRLDLPYLPDPIARGASFVGLPGALVTKVDFAPAAGRPWYEAQPFRIVLAEGALGAVFDRAARVLTVTLPKAEILPVRLSGYLDPVDLESLGIWQLIEEAKLTGGQLQALRTLAVDGRHWMITPYQTLTFVHAVRRPLTSPEFGPLKMTRTSGQTFVTYEDTLLLHLKSTNRLDVLASWTDPVDGGLGAPDPSTREASATAYNVPLPTDLHEPAQQVKLTARHQFGDTRHRMVTYTALATSRFTRHFVQRGPVALKGTTPLTLDPAGLVGGSVKVTDADGEYAEFRDYLLDLAAGTIERTPGSHITDGATVTVEYLAPPVTRTSQSPSVRDVPSSARPAAPAVLYAIPMYRWDQQRVGNQIISTRDGGGLRVYLDRPWFSSGEGELLGVVIERNPTQSKPPSVRNAIRALVTQWAADPLYQTSTQPAPNPTANAFGLQVRTGLDLSLDGGPEHVDVAGHEVAFDPDRKLWFCDLEVDLGSTYFPMVRLALVRYQPSSVPDAHLSRVVLLDFTHVGPDRTVIVTRNPATPTTVHVAVTGRSYLATSAGVGSATVLVTPEVRDPAVPGELGWVAAPAPVAPVQLNPAFGVDLQTWQGDVSLPSPPQPGAQRLVIEERELLASSAGGDGVGTAVRVVYTDTVIL